MINAVDSWWNAVPPHKPVGMPPAQLPLAVAQPTSYYTPDQSLMDPNAPNASLLVGPPAKIEGWRWWIIWLLFFATVVNYMDRQTLTSASFYIIEEFHLTNEQYGEVEAWFGLSYAIFIIVAGFLADRMSLRWLYAGALLLWSAAGFATGLAKDLITLKVCRCVLGIGESFNWPCAVGVIPRVLPREARSLANGIFNSGMTLGAIVTPLLVVAMVGPRGEGWRLLFMVVGAAGSLWVAAWLASTRGEPDREMARPAPEEGPSANPVNLQALGKGVRGHIDLRVWG